MCRSIIDGLGAAVDVPCKLMEAIVDGKITPMEGVRRFKLHVRPSGNFPWVAEMKTLSRLFHDLQKQCKAEAIGPVLAAISRKGGVDPKDLKEAVRVQIGHLRKRENWSPTGAIRNLVGQFRLPFIPEVKALSRIFHEVHFEAFPSQRRGVGARPKAFKVREPVREPLATAASKVVETALEAEGSWSSVVSKRRSHSEDKAEDKAEDKKVSFPELPLGTEKFKPFSPEVTLLRWQMAEMKKEAEAEAAKLRAELEQLRAAAATNVALPGAATNVDLPEVDDRDWNDLLEEEGQ